MTKYAIILGGGSGLRFGSSVPKQFLLLNGLPILMHSIKKFIESDNTTKIIVVLPHAQIDYWNELCVQYHFDIHHTVIEGGSTRFQSVKNAINSIQAANNDLIAVHDGVRPMISTKVIKEAFLVAQNDLTAIPAIKLTDSVRMLCKDGNSRPLLRDDLRAVQTPQTFNAQVLIKSYGVPYDNAFTDDASVVEKAGHKINLIDGDPNNIKITHSADLLLAEELIRSNG